MSADNTITITQENPGNAIVQTASLWQQACRETGHVRMKASAFLAALRRDPTMLTHAEAFDLEVPESATVWVTEAGFSDSMEKSEIKIVVRH